MHNLFDKNSYYNGDCIIIDDSHSQVNTFKNFENLFYYKLIIKWSLANKFTCSYEILISLH